MKQVTLLKRLKGFGKVKNMTSPNGTTVANQFELRFSNGSIFQSYDSIIVIKLNRKVYLGQDWEYSMTTSKYRNQFLGESKKETQEKINSGEYTLLK